MENPYPVMKAADCFALLSKYEGLPVTIDEAKLLHVPVIATRVGGIPEQIQSEKQEFWSIMTNRIFIMG